jgi:hypothetical protein
VREDDDVSAAPHRPDLLEQLGSSLPLEGLAATLSGFALLEGEDRGSERLRRVTGGGVDLDVAAHRAALLAWLRSWGCRHLRVADTVTSSRALAEWWRSSGPALPGPRRSLTAMTARELDAAAEAFAALAGAHAAWREASAGSVRVSFGETAAAKALFAIRPLAFPPWDEPIRAALGLGYREYLEGSARALRALARRLDVPVARVPAALGRPGSSPPKLVDEALWMLVRERPTRAVAGA